MDHYVSHIRRSDGHWETHNDLVKKIKKFSKPGVKKANPHKNKLNFHYTRSNYFKVLFLIYIKKFTIFYKFIIIVKP